ncbi:MAG: murein biosynthesis integral membrane protein MurJ, partial [Nitrosopumilus sp. CG10_big_fil_rev_8_21_14_0_10_33_7]
SLTPIVYNLGIIIGALLFYPMYGPIGLAYGVILGTIFHLLIQIPTLFFSGFTLSLPKKLLHPGVIEIAKLMIPRMVALGANQFMLLAIIFFASTLGTGNITIFQFANN